jgi:multidrug efflux pump subunit AcrB
MAKKKIPTEKTNPIDNIIGSQLTDERIKALENAIDRLNSEITFEVNAFTGNVAQVQSLIENATQSTSTTATDLGKLLQKYEEKIHSKRMQGIESTLLNLQKSLAEKTESHVKILKDLSKQLQEGLNAGVSGQKESIDQVANSTIKKMHELQIEQSKKAWN